MQKFSMQKVRRESDCVNVHADQSLPCLQCHKVLFHAMFISFHAILIKCFIRKVKALFSHSKTFGIFTAACLAPATCLVYIHTLLCFPACLS